MKIIFISSHLGGHTVIEFHSGSAVHKMGTFCLQIPGQISSLQSGESFEIPDDFMQAELQIANTENPVEWYSKNDKAAWEIKNGSEQAKAVNELFGKFMDAVAKYCSYDRKGAMEKRQRWADEHSFF